MASQLGKLRTEVDLDKVLPQSDPYVATTVDAFSSMTPILILVAAAGPATAAAGLAAALAVGEEKHFKHRFLKIDDDNASTNIKSRVPVGR